MSFVGIAPYSVDGAILSILTDKKYYREIFMLILESIEW